MAGNFVEWMCTQCGRKTTRGIKDGRPDPGRCPKKQGDRPHSWVKNRIK